MVTVAVGLPVSFINSNYWPAHSKKQKMLVVITRIMLPGKF